MDTNMMALEPKGIDPEYRYTFINKTGLYKIRRHINYSPNQ